MVHTVGGAIDANDESNAVAWRPWHPVAKPLDRFNWLLGLRVALAYAGPMAVAHVAGSNLADAGVISLAGLIVALIAGALPAGRTSVAPRLRLVAALPLACLVHHFVSPHGAVGIVTLAIGGSLSALSPLLPRGPGVFVRAAGLGLLITAGLAATTHVGWLLAVGSAIAVAIVFVTDLLVHPALGLPGLPRSRPTNAERGDIVRHAARLGVTLAALAAVAEWVGADNEFSAHASWMLIGVWIAMQPHRAITRDTAVQRALGTVAGGLVTLLVAALLPGSWWLGWLFLLLAFVAFGLRTVNYAWYCVVLTPIIVLGFTGSELSTQVLLARVVWTAVGVAVAVLARVLFWPGDVDQPTSALP